MLGGGFNYYPKQVGMKLNISCVYNCPGWKKLHIHAKGTASEESVSEGVPLMVDQTDLFA